jgi:D-tyrosyl-tRNA(Tyr) deacylase
MKVLLQRVSSASVSVDDKIVGQIGNGLLLLIGIAQEDSESELEWMAEKCVNLRVFEDEAEKMNCSLFNTLSYRSFHNGLRGSGIESNM